jgi:hypothetical protein
MQFAKTFPLFGRLVLGPDDELWVEDYYAEELLGPPDGATPSPRRWRVYRDDRLQGMLEVPGNVKLLQVGDTWVLCLVSRDDGQDVALMRLDRARLD